MIDSKLKLMDSLIASVTYLINHPEAQLHRHLAVNAAGFPVMPHDPRATCWCALGRAACDLTAEHAIWPDTFQDVYDTMRVVLSRVGLSPRTFTSLNDIRQDTDARTGNLKQLRKILNQHRENLLVDGYA